MERKITRVRLAQHFQGWTFEYIDQLMTDDPFTVAEIFGVMDGDAKVNEQRQRKQSLAAKANSKGS